MKELVESEKGYFYEISQKGGKKYKKRIEKNLFKPKVGDTVEIIIKPYHKKVTKTGKVKDVLTKKEFHSRGHKVRLDDGTIGRIIKIIKK